MPIYNKLPVAVNIDDHAPLVHVYREHAVKPFTSDGRPLRPCVPTDFIYRFCNVIVNNGIKGKLSYIPAPGCRGDILHGLDGFSRADLDAWMTAVDVNLSGKLDFGAEMLTHHYALDLLTGKWLDENEDRWSRRQSRGTLAPYIANALKILRDAGVNATGVTSPWMFGENVEDEYRAAIAYAMREVYGVDKAWYFLRSDALWPREYHPIPGFSLVSVFATMSDLLWKSIDNPADDEEYTGFLADQYLSADGKSGRIVEVMNSGVPVVILTHWQSLFSNGSGAGLRALNIVAGRINSLLSDRLEWVSFSQLADTARNGNIK